MIMDESDRNKVFIGSLSFESTEDGLRACFTRFGPLKRVQIPHNRDDPGRSKGFGFVTFEAERDMLTALAQKDTILLDGRTLSVTKATSSESFTKRQVSAADAAAAASQHNNASGRGPPERVANSAIAGSFGIEFTNLPPPFTWRELKDLLRRGGAEDVIHTSVPKPGFGLGEVGSDAERRRVIKTLDGTMVDRCRITVYAAAGDRGEGSRQPSAQHSGAVRQVISPRGSRDFNQNQRVGATQRYDSPSIRGGANSNGPVMRPQEGDSRKRGPEADPPSHQGYLLSRAANHAPPHLVANYAAREEARSNPGRAPVSEYRDDSRSFAGADTYRDVAPPRREESAYEQPPARDTSVYRPGQANGQERYDDRQAPVPMQRSNPPPLYNGSSVYSQPAAYEDPPSRDSQQLSYGGGAREAQRDHIRFENVLPSRNGGDAYVQIREPQAAPQGSARYADDRYIVPERISAPEQYASAQAHYDNGGAQTLYAPARDMPPPVLQQHQQEAPPEYEQRERAYQAPVLAPPPMSGYMMSSIDSLPPAQYSSRGYEASDSRAPVSEYERAPRTDSGSLYPDSYGQPAAAPSRPPAYEPNSRSVPAVSGYAPVREEVRLSGYSDDYQRGAPENRFEQAPVIYERAPTPVVYATARLPMLDRGPNEERMDGRGPPRELYREPLRQPLHEPERQYAREPVRQYPQQPPELERRSAREMPQGGGLREPTRQQQAVPEQPRQPARGPFHNGSSLPMRPGGVDMRSSRGPTTQQGNENRGMGGRDQGAGGPVRGSNTGRSGRDGRPY